MCKVVLYMVQSFNTQEQMQNIALNKAALTPTVRFVNKIWIKSSRWVAVVLVVALFCIVPVHDFSIIETEIMLSV